MFGWVPDASSSHARLNVTLAGDLPGLGYRSWRVGFLPNEEAAEVGLPDGIQPVTVDADAHSVENRYLKVVAREDGLVDLYDKTTDLWYRRLLQLEDCGDVGQGWDHLYPTNDLVIRSTDEGAISSIRIDSAQTSPLSGSLIIAFGMSIPADVTEDRSGRSEETTSLSVETTLTLDAESRRVNCRTHFRNPARCHRVRAIFPTGRDCDTWYADTAFDLVTRSVKLPDTTDWLEQAREESPVKNLAAACDGEGGFAVLTKGICEACVQDNEDRSIALTLFRGFSQNIGGMWTQDSLLLGDLEIEYALHPFTPAGNQPPVQLFQEVECYKVPILSLSSAPHPGDLPSTGRFMEITGDLVLSTIKTSEDGSATVLRLFNPCDCETTGTIAFPIGFAGVWRSNAAEERGERIAATDGAFTVAARAKEIVTLLIDA
jgi:alpha-mannosidase